MYVVPCEGARGNAFERVGSCEGAQGNEFGRVVSCEGAQGNEFEGGVGLCLVRESREMRSVGLGRMILQYLVH